LTLLAKREEEEKRKKAAVVSRLNTGSNVDIAKPLMFNKNTSKVSGFLMVYRLHFRMKIRNISVKKQV